MEMDSKQFREFGKAAIDILADYYDHIRDRYVVFAYLIVFSFTVGNSRILKFKLGHNVNWRIT